MKLNSLHHARPPVFTRMSDESSSDKSFKYIDVNYGHPEKIGSFGMAGNRFSKLAPMKKSFSDYAKRNGLYRYNGNLPPDHHSTNMRGGLDVTLLDTSPSSVNFLTLPKHEIPPNLRPLVPGNGMITFNGISLPNYGSSRRCFQTYSKEGLNNLLNSRNRRNKLSSMGQGSYVDKRGIVLSKHGPFWPPGYGPVCQCPIFTEKCLKEEEFGPDIDPSLKTQANNLMPSHGRSAANGLDPNWKPVPHFQQQTSQAKPHYQQQTHEGKRHYMSGIAENPKRQPTSIGQFYSNNNDNFSGNHRNRGGHHANAAHHHNNLNHHGNSNHHSDKLQSLNNSSNNQKPQWRGKPVIYDCERSSRTPLPHAVPEGMSESLVFESRIESGNLRQVRRIGEHEYELVLRTDMYTKRHTQWYYFRMQKVQRNVTYKINIINLLKKDSLYNYGMKPLVYSEHLAKEEKLGWHRMGENIKYLPWSNPTRNGLLSVDVQYYSLEFEISFDWDNIEEDSVYMAHCYPYTYSDLKRHLDGIMSDPEQSKHVKREVLCETSAGNACFLLTITEFPDKEKDKYKDFHQEKKGVVVTARVHPGETQASWMMKGVIDFLTSDCRKAELLRKKFIFKIVPMLNPDGVIVGNYRTSLAARDLNRNYRHPRQSTFPTIWHTKQMVDLFSKDHEILLYCDLHGHSRKPMVFMYGCERKALYAASGKQNGNDENSDRTTRDCAKDFIEERLFPWLMHKRAPDRFTFHGSKYAVRRCKESTGRVVMFRQLGIKNSFTMEASFSGTMQRKLDSGRHFNIEDFLSIGRALCESVLDYLRLCESPLLKSRIIMELTKDLAQHMLETNPQLIQTNTSSNTTSAPSNTIKSSSAIEQTVSTSKIETRKSVAAPIPKEISNKQNPPAARSIDSGVKKQEKQQELSKIPNVTAPPKKILKSTEETETRIPSPPDEGTSKEEDSPAEKEEKTSNLDDNCYLLLEQLNFQEMTVESGTSSDSDSESDPEMEAEASSSNRQKKKKKRKKRPRYMKSISAPSSMNSRKLDNKDEMMRPKAFPAYINRYTHRSNGGIPIYAQERVQERAARRLAELKLAEEEKIKRQNDILHGNSEENGLKDDSKGRYSDVYGIHYQLGPNPNKPQYTLYNPFRSTSPSGEQNEYFHGSTHQTPFRIKAEDSFHQTIAEESSQGSDSEEEQQGKPAAGLGSEAYNLAHRKLQQKLGAIKLELSGGESDGGKINGRGEKPPNPPKNFIPLQTCNLSLKFAGEIGREEKQPPNFASRYQWVPNYDEKLLKSVKELHWESANHDRTKNGDKLGVKDHISEVIKAKQLKTGEETSRESSASTIHENAYSMKNVVQYEVVIGQQRYPIHILRNRVDASGPPMITGESILNQKPTDGNDSVHKSALRRHSSADCKIGHASTDSDEDPLFIQTRLLGDASHSGSNESARDSNKNGETRMKININNSSKTNGLVFAVHKVNVMQPHDKSPPRHHRNTPYPPKRASTLFSPIVKPLSARQRTYSVSTDPDFNLNSAR